MYQAIPMQPANAFTSEDGPSPGAEHFERAAALALQMLDGKASPSEILACLVNAAEEAAGSGAVASILVLDKEGLLRNGASPKLPVDYLQAIDRLKPNARVGTCAAAAATKSVVITQDFSADDKWAELRHLPMSLGFVGAWSTPIVSPEGQVMGTFGTYFRERRQPTPQELNGIQKLATVAAMVIPRIADDADTAPRG
jgi:GAF domain-containing protein